MNDAVAADLTLNAILLFEDRGSSGAPDRRRCAVGETRRFLRKERRGPLGPDGTPSGSERRRHGNRRRSARAVRRLAA